MPFNQITNNLELQKWLEKIYPSYHTNVVTVAELKNIPHKDKQIIIVNFAKKGYHISGHWVLIVVKAKVCLFFDPFGVNPMTKIMNFMNGYLEKDIVNRIDMNAKQIQKLNQYCCGFYCMLFLYYYVKKNMYAPEAINKITFKRAISYGKKLRAMK